MSRQLLNFVIWVLAVLCLLVVFTLFQDPGSRPAASPAPQDGAQWLVALLISWLPFFFLVGVWILLAWWMRRTSGFGQGATLSARALNDPAHWRACAAEARATAERFADDQSRRQMLEIARGYEYLAQRAEERRRGSGSLS
jgi:hypothetical protein